ncbi:MAG: excinuclease ABC subunit UvrC [Candidatus Thermoplasmatota archaeon]|nr:excinuclease ABC subunit UvrC [Candidatus Thermoplasmatota archaeon]
MALEDAPSPPPSSLREKAKRLPKEPGVYTFLDDAGDPLYIGKAASLRARVTSYFSSDQGPRIDRMLEQAVDVDVVLVPSDQEALLLESSLIKAKQPKYNVRLTDDKRYPWILVSDEAHPRIDIKRNQDEDGTYYGPFPDVSSAKTLVNLLREAFGIRDCPRELPRGCIKEDIGLCMAPCHRDNEAAYLENVEKVHGVLKGDPRPALAVLEQEMEEAAEELAFERAARLRDRIRGIQAMLEKQAIFASGREDRDAVALEMGPERSVAVVLPRRGGRVVDAQAFELPGGEEGDEPQLLAEFLERYYEHKPSLPHLILVAQAPAGMEELGEDLARRAGRKVELRVPQRGDGKRLVELASKNATYRLTRVQQARGQDPGVKDLQERLRLEEPPRAIECIDVSHHGGKGVVASLVTFRDGQPHKRGYRTYKIKQQRNDDVAAMREVVTRRLKRLTKEGKDLPDLLLIDGGQGQVNAAREAARELGLEGVTFLGLAKREEELWKPGWQAPLKLPRNAPGLKMLTRARDEAHRVAINYGRKKRQKMLTTSLLDAVPGVGPTLRTRLLKAFGSVAGVRQATDEELLAVEGVGPALARKIRAVVADD